MVSILFLIFGTIDFLAGLILFFTTIAVLPEVAKVIGLALIGKGIWTIVTSIVY